MRRALLLAIAAAGCVPEADSGFVGWLPRHPLVVAHRGGAALAPENTIRAIRRAQDPDVQAEIVELDLHATADGTIVVIHDATVDRVTGLGLGCGVPQDSGHATFGEVLVADFTAAELGSLDAGACWTDADGATPFAGQGIAIPTLREVLTTFPGQRFVLEVKQTEPSIVPDLVALVAELDATARTCFLAFDEGATLELAELAPPDACLAMPSSGIRCYATDALFPFGGGGCPAYDVAWAPRVSSGLTLATPRFVRSVHAAGMPVFFWTIDEPALIEEVLAVGANGVVTDRPDRARTLLGPPGIEPIEETE